MKEININGFRETIIERSDYPPERCKDILDQETTAILGYGPQGRGQGLNMRDQGFNVVLGVRPGRSWTKHSLTVGLPGKTFLRWKKPLRKGPFFNI